MPADASPTRVRAVRRDAIENREKIMRTAAELIARRGYNVPLTEIADAAGVGVGTFYRGFPDRAALLDQLQRRGYGLLLETLAHIKADGLTGADAVEAFLHECLKLADQLVALPLRGGDPITDSEGIDAKRNIFRAIDDFLGEGRADGSVHSDITAVDIVVSGTLVGAPLPRLGDWSTTARRHIELFMRGVRITGTGSATASAP